MSKCLRLLREIGFLGYKSLQATRSSAKNSEIIFKHFKVTRVRRCPRTHDWRSRGSSVTVFYPELLSGYIPEVPVTCTLALPSRNRPPPLALFLPTDMCSRRRESLSSFYFEKRKTHFPHSLPTLCFLAIAPVQVPLCGLTSLPPFFFCQTITQ